MALASLRVQIRAASFTNIFHSVIADEVELEVEFRPMAYEASKLSQYRRCTWDYKGTYTSPDPNRKYTGACGRTTPNPRTIVRHLTQRL